METLLTKETEEEWIWGKEEVEPRTRKSGERGTAVQMYKRKITEKKTPQNIPITHRQEQAHI